MEIKQRRDRQQKGSEVMTRLCERVRTLISCEVARKLLIQTNEHIKVRLRDAKSERAL